MLPWTVLDTVKTPEGALELRQRGKDYLITIGGRVLMNSHSSGSEKALPQLSLAPLAELPAPRVLIGGLGMAITLRAALDILPPRASVVVGELTPKIVEWCKGPLAALTKNAVEDSRVRVALGDVARHIGQVKPGTYDAIILDLYEGPNVQTQKKEDPLYGPGAFYRTARALTPTGVFSVWAEEYDAPFWKRFSGAFDATKHMIGQGGRKHVVYVGRPMPEISQRQRPLQRAPQARPQPRAPRRGATKTKRPRGSV